MLKEWFDFCFVKSMVVILKYLVPKSFSGITFFPFVFLRSKSLLLNEVLLNHERIHLRQQIELLIFPFYVLYVLEFFIRYIQYKDRFLAYKNISFEREAYLNENNLDYLKSRLFWNFYRYFNYQ